ncbi:hypothetical protein BGZ95_010281 [Linnemannia exigua]|uniref:Glutamine synthetase n=1 Tax=Linnemannia exigua TaxID=604196 RepID=A0AAD4DBJ2_9FUNG|nr:hypothetical protein BGZ95_010281 [Linnemannia exigua]
MKVTLIIAAVIAASSVSAYQCPDNTSVNNSCRQISVSPLICNNPNVNKDACNAKQCNQQYIDNYAACQCRRSPNMFYEHSANVEGLVRRCGLSTLNNPYGSPSQYRPGQGTQTFGPVTPVTSSANSGVVTRIYNGTTYYGGSNTVVSGTTRWPPPGSRARPASSAAPVLVSAAPIESPTETAVPVQKQGKKKLSGGAIAGIVLGCLAALALAGLLAWCWRRKRNQHTTTYNTHSTYETSQNRGPTRTVVTEKIEPVVVKSGTHQTYNNAPANSTTYTTTTQSVPVNNQGYNNPSTTYNTASSNAVHPSTSYNTTTTTNGYNTANNEYNSGYNTGNDVRYNNNNNRATVVSQAATEELKTLLENDVRVKVAGIDLDGILRGKVMAKTKFLSVLESGFGFCSVIFGWDMHDKTYAEELSVSNAANGYKDIIAIPDLSTFRRIPWENNIPFFLLSFYDPKTRAPLAVCPRGVLKKVTDELASLGWEAMCGIEFEFYNFKETPDTLAAKGHTNPEALTPGMFGYSLLRPSLHQDYFYDIFDQCKEFGVNIEGFHTETGPGVYEAALEYDNATKMADMANLFKLSVKQLGLQRGIMPTFMAKPYVDQPGSSGHLHFSIRDINTKTNLFAVSSAGPGVASGPASSSIPFGQQLHSPTSDGEESTEAAASLNAALNRPDWETTVEGVQEMSQMMRYFTAGLLTALPSIMCILAPNINSYKRLVENYWAPVTISWGIESRVSAIRVIGPPQCEPKGTRLEMRVGGADINPHLAIAACLAAGLYGIKKRLPMPVAPTAIEIGGEGPIRGERLPKTLKESAMKMLEKGSIAREVLGDEFVEHYGATRLNEHRLWETAVTTWETKRYFELV